MKNPSFREGFFCTFLFQSNKYMTSQDLSPSEHHPNYTQYINLVPKDQTLVEALRSGMKEAVIFFQGLDDTTLNYRYAEGKWTPKEILLHVIDAERVFTYRALRFARKDNTALPGFEQDDYIRPSKAYGRSLDSLLKEYKAVREATIALYETMDEEVLCTTGVASDTPMSTRAAGFITAGHDRSHIKIIRERYLR